MKSKGLLSLAIALLMFPQIAQSMFSPALADIGRVMAVSATVASQILSVYFLAFAFGVVVWGRSCDWLGRRPSMLAGRPAWPWLPVASRYCCYPRPWRPSVRRPVRW